MHRCQPRYILVSHQQINGNWFDLILDWEKPRIFIETDDRGELVVNKETEKFLEKIIQPVVVVSVVGLYRTGKSFLLNRLSGLGQGLFNYLLCRPNSFTAVAQYLNNVRS